MARETPQREAVRRAFEHAGRPLSADEARELADADQPGIGAATVYRAINQAVQDGLLKAVALPGETTARYELASLGHHHHFECLACHKVYDIEGCPGGIKSLLPEGFTLEQHDLTLFGKCKECAA